MVVAPNYNYAIISTAFFQPPILYYSTNLFYYPGTPFIIQQPLLLSLLLSTLPLLHIQLSQQISFKIVRDFIVQ